MFQRKGYVYRFLDGRNNVLYVGKTVNLSRRMSQHFSTKSHLYKNGKGDLYQKVYKIEYITCKDEFSALQKELYYINLYKPKYNSASKIRQIIDTSQATDKWRTYKVIRELPKKQELENKYRRMLTPIVYILFFICIIGYLLQTI